MIRPEIIVIIPESNRIYDPAFHAHGAVDILENRTRKPQKPLPGRTEPEIALVVYLNIVYGIVELIYIDSMEAS